MNTCNMTEIKPEVMLGKPVIKGTRIQFSKTSRIFCERSFILKGFWRNDCTPLSMIPSA